jgi:hypothetical protein
VRILDQLRTGRPSSTPHYTPKELLPNAEVLKAVQPILIDDVADFILSGVKVGDEWSFTRDFPNVAPPFELAWYEYRRPKSVKGFRDVYEFARTNGLKPNSSFEFGEVAIPEQIAIMAASERTDYGWQTTLLLWSEYEEHADDGSSTWNLLGPISMTVHVDEKGNVIVPDDPRNRDEETGGPVQPSHMGGVALLVSEMVTKEQAQILRNVAADLLGPYFMAVSLLHCKNVTFGPMEPIPPKLQKAFRKRHGDVPRVRFHRLHIEPMRKQIREAADGDTSVAGIKRGMHLSRGHFKSYEEGRGLFGKLHGMWWWEPMVRGSRTQGVVTKEYVMHAPEPEA